jgi:hypothetical protein
MFAKKNKVNYTETEVVLSADEVRSVVAEHIKAVKKIEVLPKDITFDIQISDGEGGYTSEVVGVTALVVKRGRVVSAPGNGRTAKPAKPKGDPFLEAQGFSQEVEPKPGAEPEAKSEKPKARKKKDEPKAGAVDKPKKRKKPDATTPESKKKKSAEDWGPLRPRYANEED